MLVVHDPSHLRHDPPVEVAAGEVIGIYEVPERAERILAALRLERDVVVEPAAAHGRDPIDRMHDPAMVSYLEHAWDRWQAEHPGARVAIADTYRHAGLRAGMSTGHEPASGHGALGWWCFDTATPLVLGTYAAARGAVDVALTALDAVLTGNAPAYGLCRPPGHHAAHGVFGGYCFFNNAAVAANEAVRAGAARVTVLDVDYHHGNGTQQLFYDRGEVQYVSLHADPERAYPYITGHTDETGSGRGAGATLNVPLPAGCDDEGYLAELARALEAVEQFGPELVVVSLGVDTYRLDPIGDLGVTTAMYEPAGAAIARLGVPTVVLQEGGYHLPTIATNVASFLRGVRRA